MPESEGNRIWRPWEPRVKLSEAAADKEPKIVLPKVDATDEGSVSEKFVVTDPPALALSSVDEATAFVAGKDVAVIGVCADQKTDAAKADDIPFAITSSTEVAAEDKIEGEAIQLREEMAKCKPDDDKNEAENIKAFITKFQAGEPVSEGNHFWRPWEKRGKESRSGKMHSAPENKQKVKL